MQLQKGESWDEVNPEYQVHKPHSLQTTVSQDLHASCVHLRGTVLTFLEEAVILPVGGGLLRLLTAVLGGLAMRLSAI